MYSRIGKVSRTDTQYFTYSYYTLSVYGTYANPRTVHGPPNQPFRRCTMPYVNKTKNSSKIFTCIIDKNEACGVYSTLYVVVLMKRHLWKYRFKTYRDDATLCMCGDRHLSCDNLCTIINKIQHQHEYEYVTV